MYTKESEEEQKDTSIYGFKLCGLTFLILYIL